MSDEAVFSLNGNVNTKNVVCYIERMGGRPKEFFIDVTKHTASVMPWACMAGDGRKLRLKFFEPEMVDAERVPGTKNGSLNSQTWQQDGDRPH
jgi:hypothetical protein